MGSDAPVTREEINGIWAQVTMRTDGLQSVADKLETVRIEQRGIRTWVRVGVCLAVLACLPTFAIGVLVMLSQAAVFLQQPAVLSMLAMVSP